MEYHFSPLFTVRPAAGHEKQHEQFTLGRIDVQVPAGSLDNDWGHVTGSVDTSADLQARGRDILRTAAAMRHLKNKMTPAEVMRSSNGSLSTLESEEMLSPQEASRLSTTNAPLMPSLQRPALTVRTPSPGVRTRTSVRRTSW